MSKKNVAAYIRVSTQKQATEGKGLENQRQQIEEYCREQGLTIKPEHWYLEVRSGRAIELKVRDQMLADLKKGKIGTVIVVALDRLSRDSTLQALSVVNEIYAAGGKLVSIRQAFLNDLDESIRPVVLSVFAMIAHEESKAIGARVKAAHARAKKEGQPMGRPPKSAVRLARAVARYMEGGVSTAQVAKEFNVPKSSVIHRVALAKKALINNPPTNNEAEVNPTIAA